MLHNEGCAGGCTAWTFEAVCSAGLCEDGECVALCDNECALTDAFCVDDSTHVPCGQFDEDPCLEFGPPSTCDADTRCLDGRCVEECDNVCTLDEQRCRDDGLIESCESDENGCAVWGVPSPCPVGGLCDPVTGLCPEECQSECMIGEAECLSDSSYRVCLDDDDGCARWTSARFCFGATICEGGLCVTQEPDLLRIRSHRNSLSTVILSRSPIFNHS